MSSVFLSHNSKDKPFVRKLAARLSDEGVVVWLDEDVLNIGDSLIDEISAAIYKMEFVAAVVSQNSISSRWVQTELSLAMSREINGRQIVVLPILIDDCELPESLRDKLYADFRDADAFDTSFAKLLKRIGVSTASASPAATAPKAQPTSADGLTDIQIIGVDKNRTHNPDPQKVLYDVYLELSTSPPNGWDRFFAQERSFPRHTMWRRAWIEGAYIVVHCPIDELPKYHLPDLKEDVATANRQYREAFAEDLRKHQLEQERQNAEEQERNKQLDSLDFT